MTATDRPRYTLISADTHAGGSHEQYREYLDPTAVDAWVATFGAMAPVAHVMLYAAGAVVFLPGAVFALAGGALFGPLWGTVFNLLGATQYRHVPLIQIASFTGVYGVSFVVAAVNEGLRAAHALQAEKMGSVTGNEETDADGRFVIDRVAPGFANAFTPRFPLKAARGSFGCLLAKRSVPSRSIAPFSTAILANCPRYGSNG